MSKILLQYLLISVWFINIQCENYDDRPKIKTANGDLILQPAYSKNIYLRPNGPKSTIFIGDIDMSKLNMSISGTDPRAEITAHYDLYPQPNDPSSTLRRIERLERTMNLSFLRNGNLSAITRRVNRMQNQIMTLRTQFIEISKNKCNSRPCENGGTCLNLALNYYCLCPSNWEGQNCNIDVNECRNFAGTELGCQNGATCINRPGSYECLCRTGWFGLHCTRKSKDCSGGDFEMCAHGTCVPVTTGEGIKCICDQGWTTNGTGSACNTDVNECEAPQAARCSVNPKVECINLPGSFRCGSCPPGYEGDGHACTDIDECVALPNGGCSSSPAVACHNTIGSRICGACPPGYLGDGVTCTWRGSCAISHGGCHPSAQCIETPGISGPLALCVCPEGMQGDGVGLSGCYVATLGNSSVHCENNPCGLHGRCHPLPRAYTCFCDKGYGGAHCDTHLDYCSKNPCRNGGTCISDETTTRGYRCECSAQYSGDLCQLPVKMCGGVLDSQEGSIVYPISNSTAYNHNARCAWVIHTVTDKVVNVTFTKFDIEFIQDCSYDFLQIHDGRSSASQLIGRFCGNEFPLGGNIISSNNNLYFWFRSDHTVAKDGFALHWTSIAPVCGGDITVATHGHLSSPGWPGNYPPNRDCYWHLSVNPGKRIQLHFFQLEIESHPNCSFDYLAIYDGAHSTDLLLSQYCNSSQPAPIQTTGSQMLIHFHSDAFGSGRGFQISYATVEGVPGCGGLYTAQTGELISPSYKGKYLKNLLCDYEIRSPPNTKIRIIFKKFSLERSYRCAYDYVKIYDGISSEARLVGKFCGNTYPDSYLSSSNTLKIQFKSDSTNTLEGFRIAYETVCRQNLVGDTGVITSPNYPEEYPTSRVCEYIISSTPGKAIVLTFQDFDIEDNIYNKCRYDNVEVYDGLDANSTLLGRYCGNAPPPAQTSTHNYLYIRFNSDLSVSGTGFYANYSTIDTKCGGIYREATGLIDYSTTTYDTGNNCVWLLVAPPGDHIKLTWNRFNVPSPSECSASYLELIEIDENNEESSLGKYCETMIAPAITTSTNRLKIIFVPEGDGFSGFSVSYTYLDLRTHCGGTYIKSNGVIHSPNWPNPYEPNRDCEWVIKVPSGQQILLNISSFDLESAIGNKCDYGDFLEIRNGGTTTSPLVGKYCGTVIPKRFTSIGNALYLRFHSDFYLGGRGFSLEWDGTINGCGGTLTGLSGSITSPNYPQNYGNNAECFYRIVTSSGSRIKISFINLDLEKSRNCNDDYVVIYDGRDSNAQSLGKFCSLSVITHDIETSSNIAFIKFRSDILVNGKGFYLNYYTICNQNITGTYGVIESPNHPNKFSGDIDCIWTITVLTGNTINVTFTAFDLFKFKGYRAKHSIRNNNNNNNNDRYPRSLFTNVRSNPFPILSPIKIDQGCLFEYFQWRDGLDGQFNTKMCGSTLPDRISTKTNVLQIKFRSTSQYSHSGFRLEWVRNGCGGHFVKDYGSIKLPIIGIRHNGALECDWTIEVTPGKAISIFFSDIYMMESRNCATDALEIYDGRDIHDPLISKVCKRGVASFQTTSNYMYIRFLKQSELRDISFTGTFQSIQSTCGGNFYAQSGTIYSPKYPKNYDSNLDCLWYITVPVNHLIEFNVLDLDLYSLNNEIEDEDVTASQCGDFIKFYDTHILGKSNYSHIICPLSPTKQIISKTNVETIQFVSDHVGTAKGFKANFSVTCGARITIQNDGILTNDKLSSQKENRTCVWTILAAKVEEKISFTLTYLSIPMNHNIITNRHCPSSFLRIHDGDDEESPLIDEYCGRKVPPMIVSRGNAITVALGSYVGLTEGQFSAHYTTLDTACGGTLSSEEGSLASPNYPDSYPSMVSCEWILYTSPGNQAYITFESFNIEYSEKCNDDYLEIRENDGSGRLLGLYCGTEVPINTTIANKIYIKFHSDNKGSSSGFLAHYGFIHGSEIEGLEKGQIASPLYPHAYEGPGEYTWRIIGTGTQALTISITDIEIPVHGPHCYNSLTIYDGLDDSNSLIEELCGVLTTYKIIKTTYNYAFMKFKLDESNTGAKFNLQWSQESTSSQNNDDNIINCGSNGTVTFVPLGESVDVMSPHYGNGMTYNELSNCEWVFRTDPGAHLKLSFSNFEVEENTGCYADYVSVYSSNTGGLDWKPIREHICTINPTDSISANYSNYLKLLFKSDASVQYAGFKGVVSSECGGLLTSPSSVITFNKYCWNDTTTDYNWKIKVRPGRTIQTQIEHLNIFNQNEYCGNYLKMYNGESDESPLLGNTKFCGYSHEDISRNLGTTSNTLLINFHSHSNNNLQNFTIRYMEVGTLCGSVSQLTADHPWELINSPNYPSIPLPYTECIWVFTGPPGEILRIDFIDRFDLEWDADCSKEYIEIRDGKSENSHLNSQLCHTNPGTVKSSANVMFIKYSTQISEPRNGFKANISIDICGGTIHANDGEISSPSYPHMQYLPIGTVCEWKIVGLFGHVYKITPLDLSLPESETYCGTKVDIEEILPINKTVNIIKTFCDSDSISTTAIDTSSNEFYIKLHIGKPAKYSQMSDYRGYKFKYNSSIPSCMENIKAAEGFITTPGYPKETGLRYCQWLITAPNPSRRVRLEIIDAQFSTDRHRIGIYNDHGYQSAIETIPNKDWNPSKTVYESSGPTLAMYLWLAPLATEHHFKARFSTNDESLCGEPLSEDSGEIMSPNLNRSYFCKWHYENVNAIDKFGREHKTLYLNLKLNSTNTKRLRCRFSDPKLKIKANILKSVFFIRDVCNTIETSYRIPSINVDFEAIQGKNSVLNFHISWKTYPCGGVVDVGGKDIDVLNLPLNYTGTLDCAWILNVESENNLEIQLQGMFQLDCTSEFLTINHQSSQRSSVIGDYCKDRIPSISIVTHYKSTYVQYHSENFNSNSTLKLMAKTSSNSCGGQLINKFDDTFMSPNYPKRYSENQECTWEIITDIGRKITLQFIERFVIEDKPNCTSDAVIIYDWIDDEFKEIGKVCGRNLPPNFNSTNNKMKVVFRTNEVINLDGFKARWTTFCGGNYYATSKEQFIYSPGYPNEYSNFLDCNYHITTDANYKVALEFLDFELEGTYPKCNYDNLTITAQFQYVYNTFLHCGKKVPVIPIFPFVDINFKTDQYINKKGFKISYKKYFCDSVINQPTLIALTNTSTYDNSLNCTWSIEAPKNKIVVIKLFFIDLEDSTDCVSDYLAAYEGLLIKPEKRIAQVCGHINSTTVIKSNGNTMLLQFISDYYTSFSGFKAEVFFTYTKIDGCGGDIDLNSKSTFILKSPLMGNKVVYEPFLDCTWYIVAKLDNVIVVEFTSFHIAPCRNENQTALGYSNCKCDYVELRDGINPNSLLIGKYCGHTALPKIVSSGNLMSVRLYTDGEIESSGFEVKLTNKQSQCEKSHYYVNSTNQIITSPGFNTGKLPRGLHCTYLVHYSTNYYMTYIRILQLSLPPGNPETNECGDDKLIITNNRRMDNQTFGSNLTISLQRDSFLVQGYFYEMKHPKVYTFCGSHTNVDLYSYGDLKMYLQTTESIDAKYKGFKIELKHVSWCPRNFTETEYQARIYSINYDNNEVNLDCYTLITAPENYTINLYFITLSPVYWSTAATLKFYDGNKLTSPVLKSVGVTYEEDQPVFSTGRYLLFHNHRTITESITYDLNYIVTNKGRGCGGKMNNVYGVVTSPLYPDLYRKVGTCEWEIETPYGSKLLLHFRTFDLGKSCSQNYIQLIDRNNKVYSTFCEQMPADYISRDNYVKIVYTTSRNNAGSGWVAEFTSVE